MAKPFSMHVDVDAFIPATEEEKAYMVQMRPSSTFFRDGVKRLLKNKIATISLILILVITILSFLYQAIGRGYILNSTPSDVSILMTISSILLPVLLWTLANWCLTTLFDGEGNLRDIYIATCYSLFPLPCSLQSGLRR